MPLSLTPRWCLAMSCAPLILGVWQGSPSPKAKVDFDRQVMGVFKAHCISCHSGGEQAAGGLDLTTAKGIQKGGNSGPLFVAGKPDESLLISRVKGMNGLTQMPKGFAPLSSEQIEGLRLWIAEGASTKSTGSQHWAYVAPKRPRLPAGISGWGTNEIDRFVGERLRAEGIVPSREATKGKLLRRVSLDLTGLPPTITELDSFVRDKSANAYEKAVDRLLASPHYGERQARTWLDLARYADTNGYEADRSRQAYLYRDWVISAFNKNMPYDEFSVEQLAGDLLPKATTDQIIATGFHRNSMFNEEGGVDAEESMFETILDRVGTTSTVWMGSTMACARCHDHKFDPFTQEDFYRMYAFFANNEYQASGDNKVGQRKFYEPVVKVPTPEQSAKVKELTAKLEVVKKAIEDKGKDGDFAAWLKQQSAQAWISVTPSRASATGGVSLKVASDGLVTAGGANPDKVSYVVELEPKSAIGAIRLDPEPDPQMVGGGPGRSESGNFVLSKLIVKVDGKSVPLKSVATDFVQNGYDPLRLLSPESGHPDGVWAVYPDAKTPHTLAVSLGKSVKASRVTIELGFDSVWKQHSVSRFRVAISRDPNALLMEPPKAIASLKSKGNLSKEETAALRKYFESASVGIASARYASGVLQRELNETQASVPSALVMADKPIDGELRAPIHRRGEFLNKGELVSAKTPEFLPTMSSGLPGNRLGLAKWLFSKENPLTARVEVNRIWAQYFGRGLVETEEDFGTQGAPPSHPELLDWLACELRDNGWNLKRIHKLIVMSAAYRQDSKVSPKLRELDPENVLLARGPRFRMEAEMIRDNALKASGLLNPEIGGKSVMPYQPEGIWDSPYSGERWTVAQGKDKYRRGLYVYWKRTAPYPSFMAFDSTSRESCTVRRIRTNTPLQALALMNDQAYLDAAKSLATSTANLRSRERVIQMFKRCTGRAPDQDEEGRLLLLVQTLGVRYSSNHEDATKIAGEVGGKENIADVAAWIMTASTILNLDETITKD